VSRLANTYAPVNIAHLSAGGAEVEVLPEILRRYTAIGKREATGPAFRLLMDIVDEVLTIEKADVLRGREIVQNRASLAARDSVHIAVTERHGIRSIPRFDANSEHGPGLSRSHRV